MPLLVPFAPLRLALGGLCFISCIWGPDLPVPHVRLSQRFPRFFVRTQKLDFVNKCGRMPLVEVADGPPLATSGAPLWRPGATF